MAVEVNELRRLSLRCWASLTRQLGWRASAVVLFLLPMPLFRQQPRTDPAIWQRLVRDFESRGIAVISSHPRCSESDLFGLYIRGRRELVVCEKGDRSATLKHEGWHVVQSLCLLNQPWLDRPSIEAGLSPTDQAELRQLVRPERWRHEAEARAMANKPVQVYLDELDHACHHQLPRLLP